MLHVNRNLAPIALHSILWDELRRQIFLKTEMLQAHQEEAAAEPARNTKS
ncbi:MAG: hypothetical protein MUE44_22715 [Oscillatoriaceae cyanobacterium Prado104]|jgi:hypothetical protein|nr:hypothetical protein [Oscillatoriaceae cyanobacterium Prado104]